MSDCLFWEHAHRHRLRFRRATHWPTEAERLRLDGVESLIETHTGSQRTGLWVVEDALVKAQVGHGRAEIKVAAPSEEAAERALERVRIALPKPEISDAEPRATFAFTWKGPHGAAWKTRTLPVEPWREVAANYSAKTGAQLAALATEFRADRPGQTIVWHGDAGTGKTHALRALAWEWREWCDVHVVTDPDELFGRQAYYLMDLLSSPPGPLASSDRYRLIVLEDAGELLSRDARNFVGQGLSRFLNLCDGLMGQAEKVILLVTTNEPLASLHPAVHRAGRCAAQVEFLPFAVDEANAWLAERGELRVERPTRLCDLYALVNGHDPTPRDTRIPIGFAAAA